MLTVKRIILVLLVATGCGKAAPATKSDADCQKLSGCTAFGRCTAKGATCVATSEARCRASEYCLKDGSCALFGDSCGPGSLADCSQATQCTSPAAGKEPMCRYRQRARQCVVNSALVCADEAACAELGKCDEQQYVPDPARPYDTMWHCVALRDEDCAKATAGGVGWVAAGGECKAGKDAPASVAATAEASWVDAVTARKLAALGWKVSSAPSLDDGADVKELFIMLDRVDGPDIAFFHRFRIGTAQADLGPTRALIVAGTSDTHNAAMLHELVACQTFQTCRDGMTAGRGKVTSELPPDPGPSDSGYLEGSFAVDRDNQTFWVRTLDYAAAAKAGTAVAIEPRQLSVVATAAGPEVAHQLLEAMKTLP